MLSRVECPMKYVPNLFCKAISLDYKSSSLVIFTNVFNNEDEYECRSGSVV